jgi:putative transposase
MPKRVSACSCFSRRYATKVCAWRRYPALKGRATSGCGYAAEEGASDPEIVLPRVLGVPSVLNGATAAPRRLIRILNAGTTTVANTYTSLHFHITFSTKHRELWLTPAVQQRIWEYLGGIAKQNRMQPHRIGGIEDHVHLAISMPPTLALSKGVQFLKGGSSKWIHETFPNMAGFGWQDGYGAFTVSKSVLPDVIDYVARQREHHRQQTFQDEFRSLLTKHGVEYDERYVWG